MVRTARGASPPAPDGSYVDGACPRLEVARGASCIATATEDSEGRDLLSARRSRADTAAGYILHTGRSAAAATGVKRAGISFREGERYPMPDDLAQRVMAVI